MLSVTALPSRRRLNALGRRGAFRLHASVLVALLAASSAPTPLYALYQAAWHFSAMTLTVVFSAYALALLVALLTAGTLSDHLGRRPVLAGALLAEAVAMTVFATAQGVPALIAARILQGLATGVATSAAGAALLDFEDPDRPGRATVANGITPVAGMAVGVLAATALVQYAPAPTRTVYLPLLLLFTAQAAAVLLTPETAHPHPGAWRSLRPAITVAPASRPTLALTTPGIVAAWALGGFYSSLGPSLARLIDPHAARATGGLVFFTLTAAAGIAGHTARALPARTVSLAGTALLIPGALLTLSSPQLHSLPALFAGTAVAGAGFGAVTQGALRLLLPPAAPGERAGTLAAYYVLSYLAMSIPAVLAGLLTNLYGLQKAVSLYAATVVLLALIGLTRAVRRPRTA
ncbi:MFS transporter [Kitasatospora aureofaciens]|uniref:MFS transporter n=2 Tax=Kitasatospora aureofaciens TaxID=1894 RepID=A0A1E7N2F1_KITAU|nr:MFS transporter [Kitasatospora aureofaciens]ARF81793.1 MFS transporter [Kitasatospora aureofaciens]OEV34845.1 MFS transporter permease [Kitasatospora aureofaciens]GGU92947.1 MFS transporter [Kitasatospora aureofaciens]